MAINKIIVIVIWGFFRRPITTYTTYKYSRNSLNEIKLLYSQLTVQNMNKKLKIKYPLRTYYSSAVRGTLDHKRFKGT
jgi:hypothetical protein